MHHYVTDARNTVLAGAFNNINNAHDEGARIREERRVETFVRSGDWARWTVAPTTRCMSREEVSAAQAAAERAMLERLAEMERNDPT